MRKAIITVTVSREIELDPEGYGTDSAEDMLEMEMQYAENNLHEWLGGEIKSLYVDGDLLD